MSPNTKVRTVVDDPVAISSDEEAHNTGLIVTGVRDKLAWKNGVVEFPHLVPFSARASHHLHGNADDIEAISRRFLGHLPNFKFTQ